MTVVSGFYLGSRLGVLRATWMCASYGALSVIAAAGALARRSDTLRRISLWVRTAFGLAVVFLMIAKPDAMTSIVLLGLALGGSALVAVPNGQRQGASLSRV